MLFALRLAKAGYGSPEDILKMSVETVMAALEYESFLADYSDEVHQIIKDEQK